MRHFLLQPALLLLGFWCNGLQCAEMRTNIIYNSQITSQFDSEGAITGNPTLDIIHTPLSTEINIVT